MSASFDLSSYVRVGHYDLPEPTRTVAPPNSVLAQEASGVTYDWDTGTLFVVGDGGTSVVQVSTTGVLIDSMTLATGSSPQGTEFYDPEGITYVGGGKFVFTEERDRQVVEFTYAPGTTLTRDAASTVKLGTTIGNIGLEGLSYDPATGGFIVVKETTPEGIFQTNIDFTLHTATNGSPTTVNSINLFDPALVGTADFADVFALSNIAAFSGTPTWNNLLVLSQESARLVEVDRSGNVISSLNLVSDPGNPLSIVNQQQEGLTMGPDGTIYIVNENGGGDFDHPQLWVFAPSGAVNQAPTGIALANQTTAIEENANTAARVKVADVNVTDDGLGTNLLSVTGADAAFFEVDNTGLYIKAGTVLDFETKSAYDVTVTVDDSTVGGTPDATVAYHLALTDVANETPALPGVYISEIAPWSSGNGPVGADWFEVTNSGSVALDITGWRMDDNSDSFGASVALNGITSIAPGESVIFLETANLASASAAFISTWFGAHAPAGLQIGSYSGSGVGLSTGGDKVNLFNAAGTLQASVSFGAADVTGTLRSFNNAAGVNDGPVATLSAIGTSNAIVAAGDTLEVGSPGSVGSLFISEVAPWSSGSSPVGADWFEVTNTTSQAIDITGWKMDDSSGSPAAAVALGGITSIAPGESVIFLESGNLAAARAAFIATWFGGNAPAGLQIGSYSGAGVGLSTSGDAVNLYDTHNVVRASVTFGASPSGPFATFDNAVGGTNVTLAATSAVGTHGAFTAIVDAVEIGSPGAIAMRPLLQIGTHGRDTLAGTTGNDSLAGGAGRDSLAGGDGDDTLAGGAGIDTLAGGAGNDLYLAPSAQDVLIEAPGGGFDTVVVGDGFYQLMPEFEGLTLTRAGGATGWGNAADNAIHGSAGGDTIRGGAGNDTLLGEGGNDTLVGGTGDDSLSGGTGDDTLDGSAGADAMAGGAGDDTYVVDNAGDTVFELAGGGTDAVLSSLAFFMLPENVEALTLSRAGGATGWGNAQANALTGGAGNDTIRAGAGDDTVDGGAGIDRLTGGTGADHFVFAFGQANGDAIEDFLPGRDLIVLSGYGAGAGFAQLPGGDLQITASGGSVETIHLLNAAMVAPADVRFI